MTTVQPDDDDEAIDIAPHMMVAIMRAFDAYAVGARQAQEMMRFGSFVQSPPPIDAACDAFLKSLTQSGYQLVEAGA